jgi:hypothetical protein
MSADMAVEFMTISKLMEAQIFGHRERLVCPFGLVTVNRSKHLHDMKRGYDDLDLLEARKRCSLS